jgi:hypothetical protein
MLRGTCCRIFSCMYLHNHPNTQTTLIIYLQSHIRLAGRGGCYKHTFYGIASHQCMEMTPSLACANKCVFCCKYGEPCIAQNEFEINNCATHTHELSHTHLFDTLLYMQGVTTRIRLASGGNGAWTSQNFWLSRYVMYIFPFVFTLHISTIFLFYDVSMRLFVCLFVCLFVNTKPVGKR